MRGTFKTTSPDKVEMTLTISASMVEWKHLKELLHGQHSTLWFTDNIIQMVKITEKQLHMSDDDEEEERMESH